MKKVMRFTASWCGPCKVLTPVMEKLQEDYSSIQWETIDVDNAPHTAAAYDVRSVPTVLILRNDNVIEKFVGLNPKTVYEDAIRELIDA